MSAVMKRVGPLKLQCQAAPEGAYRLRFPDYYNSTPGKWRISGPMTLEHCKSLMNGTFNYDAVLQQKQGGKWISLGTRSELT